MPQIPVHPARQEQGLGGPVAQPQAQQGPQSSYQPNPALEAAKAQVAQAAAQKAQAQAQQAALQSTKGLAPQVSDDEVIIGQAIDGVLNGQVSPEQLHSQFSPKIAEFIIKKAQEKHDATIRQYEQRQAEENFDRRGY